MPHFIAYVVIRYVAVDQISHNLAFCVHVYTVDRKRPNEQ